ncbi:MAG: rhodanese-like domain-containing protein, partial [Bacteroidetes bacterium]|nr:rhodanese-like domain-containing protein [Bacteroidota bacterium]
MSISKVVSKEGVAIIDVREPLEFMFGHVDGAINMPLRSVPGRIDEIKAFNGPVVVYCQSGNRSGQAVSFLKSQGLTEVYNGG